MALHNASIQSFFPKTPAASSKPATSAPMLNVDEPHDGFTPSEVEEAILPTTQAWKPKGEYERLTIDQIRSGPLRVRFMGRIVNFYVVRDRDRDPSKPQKSSAPPGYHWLAVKDDTGTILVKLNAPGIPQEHVILGKLVTVWVGFVGENSSGSAPLRIPFVSMVVPVHLHQGSSSCIRFHPEPSGSADLTLCRLPLEYSPGSQLPNLMSLEAYLNSGHDDVPGARIIVCVSSIGRRNIIRPKDPGTPALQLMEAKLFDETTECTLKLWQDQIASADSWIAGETILLITNPKWRPGYKKNSSPEIEVGLSSTVDVNPDFPDADWLRKKAMTRMKKGRAHIPFPSIWDNTHNLDDALFTLAEVDDFARADPKAMFTGRLGLLVLGTKVTDKARKEELCCADCCGMLLFSARPRAMCKKCLRERELWLNPLIIGSLIDETGSIAPGKLIWSEKAWTQLFFGRGKSMLDDPLSTRDDETQDSWKDLTKMGLDGLRAVEDDLLYSRLMLRFGYSAEVGRLCVFGVEW